MRVVTGAALDADRALRRGGREGDPSGRGFPSAHRPCPAASGRQRRAASHRPGLRPAWRRRVSTWPRKTMTLMIRPQPADQRLAAQRRRADHGALRQVEQKFRCRAADEGVADMSSRGRKAERCRPSRQISVGMSLEECTANIEFAGGEAALSSSSVNSPLPPISAKARSVIRSPFVDSTTTLEHRFRQAMGRHQPVTGSRGPGRAPAGCPACRSGKVLFASAVYPLLPEMSRRPASAHARNQSN
jgi:hypothetical protein